MKAGLTGLGAKEPATFQEAPSGHSFLLFPSEDRFVPGTTKEGNHSQICGYQTPYF